MNRTTGFLIALLASCLACIACVAPLDLSPEEQTNFTVISGYTGARGLPPDFYVRINLKVRLWEVKRYPETWKAMMQALTEWAKHIPVHFKVHVMSMEYPMRLVNRPDIIGVRLIDLQGSEFKMKDKLLGVWIQDGRILLDADELEETPERAFSTSLHEIGHMLGVPHVVGWEAKGVYTGWMILPIGVDAENYVMYPRQVKGNSQTELSDLEIRLAYHTLINLWTRPGGVPQHVDDCEFLLDNQD